MATQRGRKSAASKMLKVIDGSFAADTTPPKTLTPGQADIWRKVIKSEPAGYFDSEALRGLLVNYCEHRESCARLSAMVDAIDVAGLTLDDVAAFDKLLKMRDMESKSVMRCATKLRMTSQSRYTPKTAATAARNHSNAPSPWQD